VEIRVGKANGKLLGKGIIQYFDKNTEGFDTFGIKLTPSEEVDTLILVFNNQKNKDQYTMNGDFFPRMICLRSSIFILYL